MRLGVSGKPKRKEGEQWMWLLHCPECLAINRLVRENFKGQTRIRFKCNRCDFEKEVDNPEQVIET
jgi:transposase-like protein